MSKEQIDNLISEMELDYGYERKNKLFQKIKRILEDLDLEKDIWKEDLLKEAEIYMNARKDFEEKRYLESENTNENNKN